MVELRIKSQASGSRKRISEKIAQRSVYRCSECDGGKVGRVIPKNLTPFRPERPCIFYEIRFLNFARWFPRSGSHKDNGHTTFLPERSSRATDGHFCCVLRNAIGPVSALSSVRDKKRRGPVP